MANPSSSAANKTVRVLRIGVVRHGRILEERVLHDRGPVSVGSSERNQIVLGGPGMPARFELFQLDGASYVMNFTNEMNGRVAIPGGAGEIADLRRSSLARDAGGYHQVKLDDASRGRVSIGDTSIIFEFVDPPPPVVRPHLPATLMSRFGLGVDWTFTAFVTGSFVFFFGFGLYLSQIDPIVESGLRALPDDLAHLVIDEPPPPEVEQDTEQTTDDSAAEVAENTPTTRPQESSSTASSDSANDVVNNAEAQASLANDVANQVMSELLGANGSDSAAGMVRNLLQGGSMSGDLNDMLQTASGTGVATGSGARIREAGGGDGSGTTGGLGTIAGGTAPRRSTETGPAPEVAVRRGSVRAAASSEIGGSGTFDNSQVTSRLRSVQASVNRCYEQALATTPNLEGRVGVQFTITESGSVSSVQVDAPNATLGSCVSTVVGRLRFNPAPVGGSVRYSTAFTFSAGG